jgi:hypothetical protein
MTLKGNSHISCRARKWCQSVHHVECVSPFTCRCAGQLCPTRANDDPLTSPAGQSSSFGDELNGRSLSCSTFPQCVLHITAAGIPGFTRCDGTMVAACPRGMKQGSNQNNN